MSDPVSMGPLGIYCHVPFCPATCGFCAFYQNKPYRRDVLAFLEGVEKEMALYPRVRRADSFFFGGGTPGLLSVKDLERLGRNLLDRLAAPPKEWTVEMAPSTVKADKIRMLRDLGVTRISLGVQSFDESLLEKIGRPHSAALAIQAYETIRKEGIDNLNLDLIFAVPGQTRALLEQDLQAAIDLAPEHISTYCLTYEEDTPLYEALARGTVARDVEEEADLYIRTWEILERSGFEQYEISNFTRPGFASRHNLNTWKMHEWIGLGPSAASQFGGERYSNPASQTAWLEALAEGKLAREDRLILDARSLAEDAIIFGIRMAAGISPEQLAQRFAGIDLEFLEPLWQDLKGEGLLEERADGYLALTLKGKLLADRIGAEVLSAFTG